MNSLPELTDLEWDTLRLCARGITRRQLRQRGVGYLTTAEMMRHGLTARDGARFTLCQGGVNLLYRKAQAEYPELIAQAQAEVAAHGWTGVQADVALRNLVARAMGEGAE